MNSIENTRVFEELGVAQAPKGSSTKTLGQEDFLKLMTAQLQNQDPFKPMENGEFIAQMAQFSTVTGITELRDSFSELAGSLYSNQAFQAASMVGREVLVPNGRGELSHEGTLKGAVELPHAVSNLNIGIYDLSGRVVRTIDLGRQPEGMAEFSWDGLTAEGEWAPAGSYVIRAEGVDGGVNTAHDVLIAAQVNSVTLPKSGGALTLDVAGLGLVDFSEVRQIRQVVTTGETS
jgi:flagellar basal-body rod modification protein FlgD